MKNTEIIAEYIKSGCKKEQTENLGIEIEHFVLEKGTGNNVPYSGERGVRKILEDIADNYDEKTYSEGFLIGLANSRYNLTIEPAAQLEISIRPTASIKEAEEIYNEFLKIITPELNRFGYELVTEGYRRRGSVHDLEIIPKKRYEYMDKYFHTTGLCGKHMMRSTASVQVSIDYTDENDCVKKFRMANALSPLFALICDNSKYFEGEKCDLRMLRTHIWRNVDNDRCGVAPYTFDKDFGFEKYAEYIYESPAILVMENGEPKFTGKEKISSIYDGKELSVEETEHLLSMFFPDVRLKKYIEIRPADSVPIEYALSYAALIKGIFKSAEDFDLKGITAFDVENAKTELILKGFEASVYGEKAYKLCERLLECAKKNLNQSDAVYLAPMEKIIKNRKTLREMN